MANIAQVVNVLQSMILTNEKNPEDPCVLTPTYHIFKMYNVHKEAKYIPGDIECTKLNVNNGEEILPVSFSASQDKNGVRHISLSNLDYDKAHTISVSVEGMKVKTATGEIITAKDIHTYNDFGKDNIHPLPFKDAKVKNGQIVVTLPAHSVVTLAIK